MPWLLGGILNVVYSLLLLVIAPVLVYRRWRYGKYRGGWREKLTGRLVRRFPERRCFWFHAVSVGEVLQLQRVIEDMAARYPDAEILISTTTDTGFEVARSRYPSQTVSYFPLDFTWATARALDTVRPDLVVLVELELWPNFLFQCQRRQIPVALINGRISEKSFAGYRRIPWLIRNVLRTFRVVAAQNETCAERLRQLGAPAERVLVTGNIKFDRVQTDRDNPRTRQLRAAFQLQPDEIVFIAGSTQAPEEEYALAAWQVLRAEMPQLRLILVPRHKERFEEVAELVTRAGLPLLRRSRPECVPTGSFPPVLMLDTLGELSDCWGLAEIAFVGGSLTNRGGQNMLEPAGYGAAVLFGPNTWNFKDITAALLDCSGARVVRGLEEMRHAVRELLVRSDMRQAMGVAARQFVASQQGATRRTVDCLEQILSESGASALRRAA